jgi:tetratricopeptide (TPR) repeat protein
MSINPGRKYSREAHMNKARCLGLFVLFFSMTAFSAQAQEAAKSAEDKKAEALRSIRNLRAIDPECDEAMKLFIAHRDFEAQPKLEKMVERYPCDPTLMNSLGVTLLMTEIAIQDSSVRKVQRGRARTLLTKAKELGISDDLTDYYVSTIPKDGGDDRIYSNNKEADKAMNEGEVAFAKRDFKAAIAAYTKALMLQPNLYHAVLFIGDSYFADEQCATANEWFERATKMDPNIETGYRYWGDSLMKLDKMDEARTKFLEAIVADPYDKRSWVGIQQWANKNKVSFSLPNIKAPKRPETSTNQDGQATIVLNAEILKNADAQDGTGAWAMYQIAAGSWQTKLFKEKFPAEKQYRHTLVEENELLTLVSQTVEKDIEKGTLKTEKLDPGIALLLKLHKADMLEPYILLVRSDKDLSQDYPAYRTANRDKLRQFLDNYVAGKTSK